ncbi:hypothetical protein [Streptomyces sp. NPDC058548]|uniref:hypothetical protein n=1 Tax=unclassified Streptomyces TaxID=2593676 RepID=UPI003655159A
METPADASSLLREVSTAGRGILALLLIDGEGLPVSGSPLDYNLDLAIEQLRSDLPGDMGAAFSAHDVRAYGEEVGAVRVALPHVWRRMPEEPWLLAADVLCAFTDHVQVQATGPALRMAEQLGTTALAQSLTGFLDARAGASWGLHYYTGSAVSGLISDLEAAAVQAGNPVLRGPSEHSLACGALARWQLDGAPFLIAVTSGMIDEFRGTLANLREAQARGFLVCAESREESWFPFQGTVHAAEDSRAVLHAHGVPYVYLDDPRRLESDLRTAFAAYDAGRGPVVLLATPEVLEAPAATTPVPSPTVSVPGRATVVSEDTLSAVMDLINDGPDRILWQCGPLGPDERGLVRAIAAEAGIGLADSLTRPGTVAKYHEGRPVREYLGTLGLYGYSARVHSFLHHEGRLRPRDAQAVFFLNSRVAQAATPFSPRALARSLRIVQVTRTPEHLAPFADHHVTSLGADFLRAVRERLAVPEDLRDARHRAIDETKDSPDDVLHALPLLPMSPNYFYQRLGSVLEDLITRSGYTYTGVFDVGRGGLSAVRNLPRTGPGFSGWYGRALMGDALQAVPAIALTRDDNVLAFVGDGAAGLVPDILPTLIQQICLNGRRLGGNLSVFRLVDGGHSVIRTHQERRRPTDSGRQTRLLHLLEDESERTYGELTVTHRHLHDVDPDALGAQLLQRHAVNIYSVLLSHNNEGDGLSLLSSLGWQRDNLTELTVSMARTPKAQSPVAPAPRSAP